MTHRMSYGRSQVRLALRVSRVRLITCHDSAAATAGVADLLGP